MTPNEAPKPVIPGIHRADGTLDYPAIRHLVESARQRGWIREPDNDRPWHSPTGFDWRWT